MLYAHTDVMTFLHHPFHQYLVEYTQAYATFAVLTACFLHASLEINQDLST